MCRKVSCGLLEMLDLALVPLDEFLYSPQTWVWDNNFAFLSLVFLFALRSMGRSHLKRSHYLTPALALVGITFLLSKYQVSGVWLGVLIFFAVSEVLRYLAPARTGSKYWLKVAVIFTTYIVFRSLGEFSSYWVYGGLAYLLIKSVESQKVQDCSFAERLSYFVFWLPFSSGPMYRLNSFLSNLKRPNFDLLVNNFRRFFVGCLKLFFLAAVMDNLRGVLQGSLGESWWARAFIYFNFLRIYFEFSGLTDLVISSASLLGLKLPENFNRPYLAFNLSDFWNRWHMSLTTWLRDSLFFPWMKYSVTKGYGVFFSSAIGYTAVSVAMAFLHGISLGWIFYGLWNAVGLILDFYLREKLKMVPAFSGSSFSGGFLKAAGVFVTITYISIGFLFMDGVESFLLFVGTF